MSAAAPWAAYGGQDEQGPWAKYADPLKTGAGMVTPKAPAPKLPADAGGESPISSAHAQDAAIMEATRKAHPVATSPRTIAATTGGILGGGIAGPAAGLLTRSLAIGSGTGIGNSAGQLAEGENPIDPENLKESGGRALIGAGSNLALGGLFKGINAISRIGSTPGLAQGIGHDVASKYVSPRLADAIFPESTPELGSPENPGWVARLPDTMPQVEPELGSPENPGWMAKLPTRMPQVEPELGSPENPGWVAKLPNRMPAKIGASGAGRPLLGAGDSAEFSPDDLISRTRALVLPGEQPTPSDLKRAGDLTQAPLGRLQALAKWNDVLAKNELNRRLRNP